MQPKWGTCLWRMQRRPIQVCSGSQSRVVNALLNMRSMAAATTNTLLSGRSLSPIARMHARKAASAAASSGYQGRKIRNTGSITISEFLLVAAA